MLFWLIKIIHTLNEFFFLFYVFIFKNNKYDIYYTTYYFLIFIHWLLLNNECILSYIEKKIVDENYVLGDNPYKNPLLEKVPLSLLIINHLLKLYNIIVVVFRNKKNYFIIIILTIIFIYQSYSYLYRYGLL
jgi:hypothetical protein